MRPIYLIGYMGCGKTTLGRAVAAVARTRFVDLDEYIEQREGESITEIFARRGESAFRAIEREALNELSGESDIIIATGGGTPCQPGLMDIMLATGVTVHLDTPIDVLHRRLVEGRQQRPLIASLDDEQLLSFITNSLERRIESYSRAKYRFDSSLLESPSQVSRSVKLFIRKFISHDPE